jgi:hypothetical protein
LQRTLLQRTLLQRTLLQRTLLHRTAAPIIVPWSDVSAKRQVEQQASRVTAQMW